MNMTHINHITIKESYDNDIIAYSVCVYYDNTAKTTYEFFGTAEDILEQAEKILPEAVINYYQYQIERHTENDTIIIECSESLYEKRLREDMGLGETQA